MKKLIYGVVFLAITGVTVLVACDKQNVVPTQATKKTETVSSIEKSAGLTDAQLIDIIKDRNADYPKIWDVEEVLFDNCQLSSSVLRTLADDSRFPNYIVEEMAILSAPSNADIAYISAVRPTLATTTILSASSIDLTEDSQFAIDNTNPRKVFIAKNLEQTSLCTDGCGESEWKGQDFKILDLTSTTPPLDPVQRPACNPGRWVCGRSIETRVVDVQDGVWTVYTKCQESEERCVRKASRFKD